MTFDIKSDILEVINSWLFDIKSDILEVINSWLSALLSFINTSVSLTTASFSFGAAIKGSGRTAAVSVGSLMLVGLETTFELLPNEGLMLCFVAVSGLDFLLVFFGFCFDAASVFDVLELDSSFGVPEVDSLLFLDFGLLLVAVSDAPLTLAVLFFFLDLVSESFLGSTSGDLF